MSARDGCFCTTWGAMMGNRATPHGKSTAGANNVTKHGVRTALIGAYKKPLPRAIGVLVLSYLNKKRGCTLGFTTE